MATKKKSKKKKPPNIQKKARTPRLPGMEDAGIPALESIAENLADIRGQRIALSKQEGALAEDLLKVMKKHRKVEYHHEEVHVWLRVTEEKVKVKIGELDEKAKAKAAPPDVPAAPETDEAVDEFDPAEEVGDAEEGTDEYEEEVEVEGEDAIEG